MVSSQPPPPPPDPENQHLSLTSFHILLRSNMLPKPRSLTTHQETHTPSLFSPTRPPITTLLIGDSMFERFKTTGIHTRIAQSGSQTFNAGVGGDKVENVLYRLDLGLLDLLSKQDEKIKICIVMVGTNNLGKKTPLKVDKYRLLVQALLRISDRVLCCEIFKRKDIEYSVVEESNRMLREMIGDVNTNLKDERVRWLEAPPEIGMERLVDHVHLDEEGYGIWDKVLWERIEGERVGMES
ncbi:SGNH hydrolase [Mollisia scopiformis]|uniref:SGNH hydrolase n=1 Tax=Mollisia scopiformis TaxID=149040 RepID=A0A194XPL4_MOLSC|nr:SGNH hydrolase [Mollisia scopiformis]KUJ22128.1 SGNH hydrolase [Mollisia scopiformis]